MSIFGSIVSAIFGHSSASAAAAPSAPASSGGATAASAAAAASAGSTASAGPAAKPMSQADVVAMIEKAVGAQHEDLDWKHSIVDLMKALKLDSSLTARKQLAQELGYTGALDGSAQMNIWLHQQVMAKLAEGGGTVPASLRVA